MGESEVDEEFDRENKLDDVEECDKEIEVGIDYEFVKGSKINRYDEWNSEQESEFHEYDNSAANPSHECIHVIGCISFNPVFTLLKVMVPSMPRMQGASRGPLKSIVINLTIQSLS